VIDKKYEKLLFSFVMGLFMSFFMSFVITLINMGLVDQFISIWLQAFWKAFLIAFPTILFIVPKVRMVVTVLIKN